MKAIQLKKYGHAEEAFQIVDVERPKIDSEDVLIKVTSFGLNYADVMARNGIYNDAPPLPAILGYECVGIIEEIGSQVQGLKPGNRVMASTRFGAYAEYVKTNQIGVVKIPDSMGDGEGCALTVQYATAWFSAIQAINIEEGEHVLIHAAAGGVGTALVQLCKSKGCVVYGTASSDEKLTYLKDIGVDHPINYSKKDFAKEVMKIRGKKRLDVIFDPVGGKSFKKGLKVLAFGGRIVIYGASSREEKGFWKLLKLVFGFGFHTPVANIMKSQSWVGVNMLRIGDTKPELIRKSMVSCIELYEQGIAKPHIGGIFKANEIASAHALLGSRKSIGKIIVEW